ncbi:MAG: hypothetical protein IJ532_04180 [Alphaproteobacteria bacterium]|nr:hypothetical protein [Alphaproteobacteria bacterium]
MLKKISLIVTVLGLMVSFPAEAQYVNLSGNNPDITEYVESNEDNWNKSIMYVFYSNEPCAQCSQAMGMIYDIYEEYFINQFNLFEINYTNEDEYGMQESYNLSQPLSVVLVRINDGMSRGYYKIENPQFWVNDPYYFKERLLSEINNFLNT